ncbi:MAG: alpha/beta hydrolase [Tabrizicola sp.]|nr:alpha/beta hydrolase [Tabrizicola sp.]
MDYVFCSRNVVQGKFGSNPGPTRYLEVPANAGNLSPDMTIPRRDWFDRVMAIAETRRTPQNRPVGDVLIYIHGFNVSQALTLARHRAIRKGLEALGYAGAVVSYDWPAAETALNYLDDRTDAKLTALRLVSDGIGPLSRYIAQGCEISVHALAHSMGAFVLREALDDADDRREVAATGWTLNQVMIAAGDVSVDSMGMTAKSSSLYRRSVRLTNYSNPYDAVLSISNVKRVGVSPRVGRIGLPADAPRKAVNVDVGIYYDEHRDAFAQVTNSDHAFYFSSREFLKDVYLTLLGEIDRNVIPTRLERDGKLYLRP